ncbi:hypothetical protein [Parapedobacter koreensis]|uniref:Uncharacterized protein n=1 Tax=Parapedobacter koreensis TaxID=332977 RepID=A0A1H7UAL6_9SPHI|nr:hypothetical protein [Parapedobacter koreensis]SEL93786.1 hypothetical protein SAMN05421740_11453 [Parapedobacter koreensis]
MQNFTQQERQALLNALQAGRQNAINAVNLAATLGYPTLHNQPKLRKLIKECIELEGDLIASKTSHPRGFFLINDEQELENYLDSLESRTRRDNDRRNALIANWNNNNPASPINRQPLTII